MCLDFPLLSRFTLNSSIFPPFSLSSFSYVMFSCLRTLEYFHQENIDPTKTFPRPSQFTRGKTNIVFNQMQLGLRVKISSQLKLIRPPNSVSEGFCNCCSSVLHVKAVGGMRGVVLADMASSAKLTPTRRLKHSWNLKTELPVPFPLNA